MNFIKGKAGIIAAFICLLFILAVVWFCLMDMSYQSEMHGTFVESERLTGEMRI